MKVIGASGLLMVLAVLAVSPAFAKPPKLVAAFFIKGKVGLKWQKIAGAEGYVVYRAEVGGEFAKIASTDEDHYFDLSTSGGVTYRYRIGIMEDGQELFSREKSVTIPGQSGDFKAPKWVGLRVDNNKILLNWDPVPGAVAYNVFRSMTPGSEHEIIGNAQGSRYADNSDLIKGETYYYVLSALNGDFDETDLSTEKSIRFGISLEDQQRQIAEANRIELEDPKLTLLFEIKTAGHQGALNQPCDVFVNSEGNIYLTDMLNGRIHCYDGQGDYLFSFGNLMRASEAEDLPPGGFMAPLTLFIDGKDQVYVSDVRRHDIQVFTAAGKFIRKIRVDTGADNEPLRAAGMHVYADGHLVITDTGNHRLLILESDGRIRRIVGKRGDEEGEFNFPDELVVSPEGKIIVVDSINCRVQIFDKDANFVRSFGGVGLTAGTFGRPKGVTLDAKGRIWVSDGMSHMIQSFTQEGEIKVAIGTAKDDWAFSSPRGVHFHGGRLFITNRLANSLMVLKQGD